MACGACRAALRHHEFICVKRNGSPAKIAVLHGCLREPVCAMVFCDRYLYTSLLPNPWTRDDGRVTIRGNVGELIPVSQCI